jgi:hypothetical protein
MKALKHAWLRLNFGQQNISDIKGKQHNEKLVCDSTSAARI